MFYNTGCGEWLKGNNSFINRWWPCRQPEILYRTSEQILSASSDISLLQPNINLLSHYTCPIIFQIEFHSRAYCSGVKMPKFHVYRPATLIIFFCFSSSSTHSCTIYSVFRVEFVSSFLHSVLPILSFSSSSFLFFFLVLLLSHRNESLHHTPYILYDDKGTEPFV